jgi:glucose/mannose-6-phosphate isomerase
MMRQLITDLPEQLQLAFANARDARLKGSSAPIRNAVIIGMGGSGIGGTIVSRLIASECPIPILSVKDYDLPSFVDDGTLAIVCSYSGNTEETYMAMEEALGRGAQVACISSGGKIGSLAVDRGLDWIEIPGGNPPRSQFGYSAISLFRLLSAYGLIKQERFDRLEHIGSFLQSQQENAISRSKALTEKLANRIIILYAADNHAGVAVRWRQQINENAKRLCWHHVYPEMNHNELVGWDGGDERFGVILLRSTDDHERSSIRMNITEELFLKRGALVENVVAQGNTPEERCFDLIQLGDWLSLHLAEYYGVDPVAIPSIDYLKSELSKV